MKTVFYNLELGFRYLKYVCRYNKMIQESARLPDIRSTDQTLDRILKERCSVSRYGDGEFDVILGGGNAFCDYSPFLAEKLRDILYEEIPAHIVCLPYAGICQENLNLRTKVFWMAFFCKTFNRWKGYLKPGRIYYNTDVTRFYFAYKNKSVCSQYLKKIRQIWAQQDVLLIEGEYSRLGVSNDLFSDMKSLKRILAPSKNAYTRYDEIMAEARKFGKGKLIMIALGQTATALAYDLAKEGYWAIDIGHLDIEYEWFLRKAKDKIKIAGKHVNEAKYVPVGEEFYDAGYEQQIVARIL